MRLIIKTIKGKNYAYLEEPIRMGSTVRKISKYLGLYTTINKTGIENAKGMFKKELFQRKVGLKMDFLKKTIKKLEYPFCEGDISKIEEMNLKYKEIIRNIHPKNLEDLHKRFIANYVFESNALEGNSLTLKNVTEIVFENRIGKGKALREIYDAQNSYNAFLFLQKIRTEINHDFVVKLHSKLMANIDDRLGYRNVPVVFIGKPNVKLSSPENVYKDMGELFSWYNKNEDSTYPLELAFKFHAKFEKIHPFCDGNGRVGRLLLNYILLRKGYFPIIIRTTTRNSYLKALEAADSGKWIVLMRFALKHYKETFRKFFEIYYDYAHKQEEKRD